jgi:hypothetical protein
MMNELVSDIEDFQWEEEDEKKSVSLLILFYFKKRWKRPL